MSSTPNMNITQPNVNADNGVWGTELNGSLSTIDAHDHTTGNGVKVPTAGLNINADLDFNGHKLTDAKGVQVNALASAATGSLNANTAQSVTGDLYWTNGAGVAVQVTSGNSIASTVSANTPAGIILPYAGTSAPSGYLLANGGTISRSTYAALFTAIGTTYGAGDGTTTFGLPNMQGRVPVGAGTYSDPTLGATTRTLGATGGEASHVVAVTELPAHTHTTPAHSHSATTSITDPGHSHTIASNTTGGSSNGITANSNNAANAASTNTAVTGITASTTVASGGSGTSGSTGSGASMNVMQPYVTLNYIIKT